MMRSGYAYTLPRTRGVREHEPRPEAIEEGRAVARIRLLLDEMERHVRRAQKLIRDAENDVAQLRRGAGG